MSQLSLDNPFESKTETANAPQNSYEQSLAMGRDLLGRPLRGGGKARVLVQTRRPAPRAGRTDQGAHR